MDRLLTIKIALGCLVLVYIYDMVMGFKRRKWKGVKYSLKNSVNNGRLLISMLVALYVCLGMVYIIAAVTKWVAVQPLAEEEITNILVQSFPVGLVILTIWLIFVIIRKGVYPKVKYNEEELQWKKESDEMYRNSRIGKIFRIGQDKTPKGDI